MKEAFEVRIKPHWDIPTGDEIDDDNGLISKDDDLGMSIDPTGIEGLQII